MAPDFSKIKNKQLSELITLLPYFEIFSETTAQEFINEISEIPEIHTDKLIDLLTAQIKTLPKLSTEEKNLIFEAEIQNLIQAIKDFKKDCLVKGESIDKKESETKQEALLSELENL